MVRTSRVIPKDWSKYSPVGVVIPNTRFIVFKTPLSDELCLKINREHRFTWNHLFRTLAERGERLGLVVDLTDTTRYYDKKAVEGMCVEYEKVFCPGRGFVEREDVVDQFSAAIQRFIDRNDDKRALIGVHCTRGVNRSGYLVCRFLIDVLGWSSHEAIEAFEKARGSPIEKGSYIQTLHKAAREAANRKMYERADSDADSMNSRKAKKRKRKQRNEDGNVKQMGDMIKQFFGVLGQEASQLEAAAITASPFGESSTWPSAMTDSPMGQMMEDGADEEVDEDGERWELGGKVEGGKELEGDMSLSSRRRARRKRLEKMFDVMKKGRFHEIREIHKEKYGT